MNQGKKAQHQTIILAYIYVNIHNPTIIGLYVHGTFLLKLF